MIEDDYTWTQDEFSKLLGISRNRLNSIENNRAKLSAEEAKTIAHLTGFNPEKLLANKLYHGPYPHSEDKHKGWVKVTMEINCPGAIPPTRKDSGSSSKEYERKAREQYEDYKNHLDIVFEKALENRTVHKMLKSLQRHSGWKYER